MRISILDDHFRYAADASLYDEEPLRDEYEVQFSQVFDQIVVYAEGRPINVVNPPALQHSAGGQAEKRNN